MFQGSSQNLKHVPQNFMKVFNVDDVALLSRLVLDFIAKLEINENLPQN